MRNILKYRYAFITAAFIAGVVFTNCNLILAPPDSSSSNGAGTAGKTLVRIDSSNGGTRTLMPVMINENDVSKYEVSITKAGSEGEFWTAESDDEINELRQDGHGFILGIGIWTVKIDAYRGIDGKPYMAGSGTASLEVTAAGPNTVSVTISEIPRPEWDNLEGVFTWNLTLPEGVAIKTAALGGEGLEDGTGGSINIKAGIYQYFLILEETATGLTTGIYERVYIYPGLETPAVFDFTGGAYKLVFAENIPVSGTLGSVAGISVNPDGTDFTMAVYGDAGCSELISIAPVDDNSNWTVWIPVKPGQTVYFKAGSLKWSLEPSGGTAVELTAKLLTGVQVPAPAITALGGTVSIGGEPFVGSTLTAETSGLTGQSDVLFYQWKAGGSDTGTEPGYIITAADVGKTITVTISSQGRDGNVTSGATAAVKWSTVTFAGNGNNNSGGIVPAPKTASYGSSVILPGPEPMTRTEYTFSGWNSLANGTGTPYAAGASYTVNGDSTLYARWTQNVQHITNPFSTVEGTGATTGSPAKWSHNEWYEGTKPSFTYTWENEGRPGGSNRSLKVKISGATIGVAPGLNKTEGVYFGYTGSMEGDAKWAINNFHLEPGKDYVFSDWYKSDVDTEVILEVVVNSSKTDNTIYLNLPPAPASPDGWTEYREVFTVPPNTYGTNNVNVYHVIKKNGYLQTTDYLIDSYKYEGLDHGMVTITFDDDWEGNPTNAFPYMFDFKATVYFATRYIEDYKAPYTTPKTQIQKFIAAGHEIGAHSVFHPWLTAYDNARVEYEVEHSKEFLETLLGIPMKHFATPFGNYNTFVKETIMETNQFTTHRTVDIGYNSRDNLDLSRLRCMGIEYVGDDAESLLYRTTDEQFNGWVTKAKEENLWLILLYHAVVPAGKPIEGSGVRQDMFIRNMQFLKNSGIQVLTISDALEELRRQGALH